MKDYRKNEMKCLMIVYILLFLMWSTDLFNNTIDSIKIENEKILSIIEYATISGIISLFTLVCDSIISSNLKDKLVKLFVEPKSGATIFTRIKNNSLTDNRFMNNDVQEKYNDIIDGIPVDKNQSRNFENVEWYKIYVKHKNDESILLSQKDYLLCRDLYIETLLFIIIYLISIVLFVNIVRFSCHLVILLVIVAIFTNIATRVKMSAFVNNVIVKDLYEKKK